MPETGTKPPSPAKAAATVAATAGVAALLIMWLTLSPPPSHYRTVIEVLAVAGVIAVGVLILAWLVRFVEYRFVRRHKASEEAQCEHRQFVRQCLTALVERQRATEADIAAISEVIVDVEESIDELREAFVEEGLPRNLGLGPASRPRRRGRETLPRHFTSR